MGFPPKYDRKIHGLLEDFKISLNMIIYPVTREIAS